MSKIIDIHVHAGSKDAEHVPDKIDGRPPHYICGPNEMMETLAAQGISNAILMSGGEYRVNDGGNLKIVNQDCMEASEKSDGFFKWMCGIDPVELDTIESRLAQCKEQGAVGVGEVMVNQPLDSRYFQKLFSAAEKLEMPVLCHMSPEVGYSYGAVDNPGLPLLERVLQEYPKLKFIGHSQVFWIEISADAPTENTERSRAGNGPVVREGAVERLLNKYPNLYADLSAFSGCRAIMRDPEFGIYFLEKFQDRLFFGTDTTNKFSLFPTAGYLKSLMDEGKISKTAYEKITFDNAKELFGF